MAKTKDSNNQKLLKEWVRFDGKRFKKGDLIDVDRIKTKELIKSGHLADPNKPKVKTTKSKD